MKVGLVNNQFALYGGGETVMRQVWKGLCGRNIPNQVIVGTVGRASSGEATPMYPRLLDRLQYTRFQSSVERLFPRYPRTDKYFRELWKRDLSIVNIHNFFEEYATLESLAELSNRMPVVWTVHCTWPITGGCLYPKDCLRYLGECGHCPQVGVWPIGPADQTSAQLRRKIEIISNARFTALVPSHHMAARVAQSPVGRNWDITVVHNGVDVKEFKSARKQDPEFRAKLGVKNPEKPLVCIVIRDFKAVDKGFRQMLRAVEACQRRDFTLALAGANSDWAARQIPSDIAVADQGFKDRNGVAEVMEASDVFLFASPAENLPCVILEAMASKACIVSTPTDGVLEEVNEGCAFLAEGFDGDALAAALGRALADRTALARKRDAAYDRVVSVFSEEKMIDGYVRLFEDRIQSFNRKKA